MPIPSAPPASESDASLDVDVLVVGGGINGAGIARDLAGRGASVVLCEQDDLASHTSSASTKLVHGGLRYLEHREFSLVRKALAEREVLLRSAPHIIWPLRFVMPHDAAMRPAWMIRAGLFLYDHLARRELLPGSRTVDLRRHAAGGPLKATFTKGFVYSDGWVDDARLVVLNAVDAGAHGATVLTRTRCVDARRDATHWTARLERNDDEDDGTVGDGDGDGGDGADGRDGRDGRDGGRATRVRARVLVNAAGPWAAQFLGAAAHIARHRELRLVKGSHIVVPKLFDHDHAYIFQNPDKRIIFAIPYEGEFTLIGTTDVEASGPVGSARIDAAEIAYLCEQASRYFSRAVRPDDVVWTYSGVRPLLEDEAGDASAVTRDYQLDLDDSQAPLLTVWGGKITTFRKLAEEAADRLAAALPHARGAWTRAAPLPGGDLRDFIGAAERPDTDFARFERALEARHPALPSALRHRLARAYGSRIALVLAGAGDGGSDLGAEVAPGLHVAELAYLHAHEWARRADDVLWRRSKLGLHFSAAERAAVARWCEANWPRPAGATISERRARRGAR